VDVKFSLEVSGRAYLQHDYSSRVEVEITRGARGQYRWSVKMSAGKPSLIFTDICALEQAIAAKYGEQEEANSE
jgi:hypothetical protein